MIGFQCFGQSSMTQKSITTLRCNTYRMWLLVEQRISAIAGYGYSGELYGEALQKLESRFGKPHVVVKAHLNYLQKWSKLSDERLHKIRRFADIVSGVLVHWKFEKLRKQS